MTDNYNYLESYLDTTSTQEKEPLPLYHTCSFLQARDYIRQKQLFPRHCKVFLEDLIYLFLGRAEYRDYNSPDQKCYRPIGFVIDPKKIPQIKRIYPFDTGAVAENKYGEIFEATELDEVKNRYCLGNHLKLAYSLIKILYGTPLNYINQKALDDAQITCDAEVRIEIESIKKIHKNDYKKPDNRKATIEVQVLETIPFKSGILTQVFAPGLVISSYQKLQDLINELEITPQIKPDSNAAMENAYGLVQCFFEIRNDSIKLSTALCNEN